jgi:ribosome maturation protein Sdo1
MGDRKQLNNQQRQRGSDQKQQQRKYMLSEMTAGPSSSTNTTPDLLEDAYEYVKAQG